ncbi:MAG TPA: DNA recombination protein RmuC [Steroidobacteraceae bacterium]|nr:DNA recombination protein RmuC [Steroidobacteraceae bacterium]HRX89641.1 DNA recombination protein RmuC [Steroidobacteraceae bacterium]
MTAVEIMLLIGGLALGVLLGYLIAALRAGRQSAQLRVELAAAEARLQSDEKQLAHAGALLEQSEARLRAAFDELADNSLRNNSETFLRLARESLSREQVTAHASLKERETAISQMLEPIRVALAKSEQQVQALERERLETFGALRGHIENLGLGQAQLARETRNLVTALRRPEVRGRWGEITLRRVVELAGLSEHCDFTEQFHVEGTDRTQRPDLVVHLPDHRDLVVDAKTPFDAFLEAIDAEDEPTRRGALVRHARQVETRVRELSNKSYWSQFERSPDFAILFLPGDQFLSAALAESPEIVDQALKRSVIIATPSTLMAVLKVVAYTWRQSQVAENAATIRQLGQDLHDRLSTFANHLGRLGKSLSGAVDNYNAAVGSLERNVMPQARRFPELGVTADAPLPIIEPIDRLLRTPTGSDAGDGPAPESSVAIGKEISDE